MGLSSASCLSHDFLEYALPPYPAIIAHPYATVAWWRPQEFWVVGLTFVSSYILGTATVWRAYWTSLEFWE